MTKNALGIEVPAGGDAFNPQGDMVEMAASMDGRIIVPVPNTTARDALAASLIPTVDKPLYVLRADAAPSPCVEWSDGTRWHVLADTRLGRSRLSVGIPMTVAGTPAWTTVTSVTATSRGGVCSVYAQVILANANSGATRTGSFRITVDGVALTTPPGIDLTLAYVSGAEPFTSGAFQWESQPVAGSHTWALQANGSAGASVRVWNAALSVTESP